jgi:trehalose-phosphatase
VKTLRPAADPEAFLDRLAGAPARVLMLDYDGCLAPFREERDRAVPYPGVREALGSLREGGHTRVVVVTGRALDVVVRLLGVDPLPEIWGSHGWEKLAADGTRQPPDLDPGTREALREARLAVDIPELSGRVEDKPASVAVHVRGLAPERAAEVDERVREVWNARAGRAGLEIHSFDGGVELRVPGRDKGTAVRETLAHAEPGTVAAYLGDDLTDEDAFRELRGRGLSVLVRPELRATEADVWLRPPAELLEFLAAWDRRSRGERL